LCRCLPSVAGAARRASGHWSKCSSCGRMRPQLLLRSSGPAMHGTAASVDRFSGVLRCSYATSRCNRMAFSQNKCGTVCGFLFKSTRCMRREIDSAVESVRNAAGPANKASSRRNRVCFQCFTPVLQLTAQISALLRQGSHVCIELSRSRPTTKPGDALALASRLTLVRIPNGQKDEPHWFQRAISARSRPATLWIHTSPFGSMINATEAEASLRERRAVAAGLQLWASQHVRAGPGTHW
jgi:hypothetical protein